MRPDSASEPPRDSAACLTDEEILSHVSSNSPPEVAAAVLAHLDRCPRCRVLVSAAVQVEAPSAEARVRTLDDGERIAQRFIIERFMAAGGMGEVYEAEDTLLRERVALKTLACTQLDRSSAFKRMRSEVQLARRVTHPNVCRILDFGVHTRSNGEQVPFLTMELLSGETLGTRITREGALPPALARSLLNQMVQGLAAIHDAGIVHRDFKSDNVFLVPRGERTRAVVMDFGLARPLLDERVRSFSSGGPVGTADYMAPEQLLGHPAIPSSDTYALGVVAFEMITGRLPFPGAAAVRLLDPAPRPSSLVAGLEPVWDEVVSRCLEKEPERRYATVRAVMRAFRQSRPRRLRRLAVVGVALGGLAAGAVALWGDGAPAPPAVVNSVSPPAEPPPPPPQEAPKPTPEPPPPAAPPAAEVAPRARIRARTPVTTQTPPETAPVRVNVGEGASDPDELIAPGDL